MALVAHPYKSDSDIRQPSIGDYCLLHKPEISSLPWPAIMCPDHFAPQWVLKNRPNGLGCFHLVILIKEKLEFCFALTTELQTFEPYRETEEMDRNLDLRQAFDLVYEAMDFGSALQYWEAKTENLRAQRCSPKRERSPDFGELSTSDARSWKPAKRNQAEKTPGWSITRKKLPTPPSNVPESRSIDVQRATPAFTTDIRNHFPLALSTTGSNSRTLPLRPAVQPEDVVEGDLARSKQFIELRIGPDKIQHLIPFDDIKHWDHFFNYHHGSRKFDGQNTYTVDLPCLETISPEDFRYAAEFISTREFGIRLIDDENRDIAIAECIAAWEVADKLCIEDMLEHVLKKSQQAMPWSTEEVTYFAGIVYKTTDSMFKCYKDMKELLSEYIAAKYYDIIEKYGETFTSRMRNIAELERDVFKKLMMKAEQRMEA